MQREHTERTLQYELGDWVEVTVRREGANSLVRVGKIVEATRDCAVAECRGVGRFTWSDDTDGYVIFRRMTQADWAARKRAKARR